MRRKHGGRESWGGWGGGDAESEWEERDAVISTAERKWGCQDKDRLRQREKEIRGRLRHFEERQGKKGSK